MLCLSMGLKLDEAGDGVNLACDSDGVLGTREVVVTGSGKTAF